MRRGARWRGCSDRGASDRRRDRRRGKSQRSRPVRPRCGRVVSSRRSRSSRARRPRSPRRRNRATRWWTPGRQAGPADRADHDIDQERRRDLAEKRASPEDAASAQEKSHRCQGHEADHRDRHRTVDEHPARDQEPELSLPDSIRTCCERHDPFRPGVCDNAQHDHCAYPEEREDGMRAAARRVARDLGILPTCAAPTRSAGVYVRGQDGHIPKRFHQCETRYFHTVAARKGQH